MVMPRQEISSNKSVDVFPNPYVYILALSPFFLRLDPSKPASVRVSGRPLDLSYARIPLSRMWIGKFEMTSHRAVCSIPEAVSCIKSARQQKQSKLCYFKKN